MFICERNEQPKNFVHIISEVTEEVFFYQSAKRFSKSFKFPEERNTNYTSLRIRVGHAPENNTENFVSHSSITVKISTPLLPPVSREPQN